LLYVWPRGGVDFPAGLRSGLYSAVTLALFTAGIFVLRSGTSPLIAAVLLFLAFTEYKAFGTNRAFNAVTADLDAFFKGDRRVGGRSMIGVHDDVYQQIVREPWYRLAIVNGPASTDMRFYRIATPQGADPLVTAQYKAAIEEFVKFHTNRLFDIDPRNLPLLDRFGVKFVMVRPDTDIGRALREHPDFVRLEPADSFFHIYAYRNAKPSWRFDGDVEVRRWTPERREFESSSPSGGKFGFIEQLFPGWHAYVDGREVPIHRWKTAFQSIDAPAGRHRVRFEYRPASFRIGAGISLLSLIILTVVALKPVSPPAFPD
jgi:Bacterial membrane protein YfhO